MFVGPQTVAIAGFALKNFQPEAFLCTPTTLMRIVITKSGIPLFLSTLPIPMGTVAYVILLKPGGSVADTVSLRRTVVIGFEMLAILFLAFTAFGES